MLVDDHSLFRESLSRLLEAEPEFHVSASCASTSDALDFLSGEQVDIVLLDFDLGEEQATVFLEALQNRGDKTRVLMVTAGMSDGDMVHSFESGISGVFLKHRPPDQLVQAIKQVVSGEAAFDLKAVRQLISGARGAGEELRAPESLTPREQVVMKAVFTGLTNKEIAVQLQVSESSVKAVLQQLFAKSGVRSRSQLVRIALENQSKFW